MKLVSVANLASYIGFDAGVASAQMETATEVATQTIIGVLNTDLELAAVADQFYILPTGSLPLGRAWRTRLALSRGFIQGPVEITFGSALNDLSLSANSYDNTFIAVDRDLGGIVITGPDLRGQFVQVSYVAGFDLDETAPGQFASDALPEWLVEAAQMAAVATLDETYPDLRFDKGQGAKESAASMRRGMAARLQGKLRYFPSATHPIG